MAIRFLGATVLISVLSLMFNCSSYKSHNTEQANALTKASYSTPSPEKNDVQAMVKSVELYAWWWSSEQLKVGFDERNPPPKKTYIKLDQWEDTIKPGIPHPERVDVVCQIENKGNTPLNVVVLATGDWIVAPQWQYSDKNIDKITDEVAWTEETQIGREVIQNLAPGETREVKIKDFNLGKAIRYYYDDSESNPLWPWKFRVHVYIEKSGGERVSQEQTILPLFPSRGSEIRPGNQ
jgi:hypothetical protein